MTNRQLAAQETRSRLLEASRQIICKKGLANTSVEEITGLAGVSKGTFYTYFQKKEDVVYELSNLMFQEILEHAKKMDGSFYRRLRTYMEEFSDYIEKGSIRLAQEWVRNVVNPPILEDGAGISKWRQDVAAVRELLQIGISEGQLKKELSTEEFAQMLADVLYGQLLCWCINDGRYSLRERTEEFCRRYLEGLLEPYEEENP